LAETRLSFISAFPSLWTGSETGNVGVVFAVVEGIDMFVADKIAISELSVLRIGRLALEGASIYF
jgi:hypothetical protein